MLFSHISKRCIKVSLAMILASSTAQAQYSNGLNPFEDKKELSELSERSDISLNNTPQADTLQEFAYNNPANVADAAYTLLEKGLYNQATTLFGVLSNTNLSDVADYGKALTLAQTGQFEEAYTLLSEIKAVNFTAERVHEEMNVLSLLLAQQYLIQGNTEQSQRWLRRFVGNTATDEDRAQFSRIYTSLQTLSHPAEAERLRLGMLVPLSGPLAPVGKDIYNAAQMALFEMGIRALYIYPQDTAGTAEGAKKATENAFKDGAQVLIGPMLAENTQIAAEIAQYHKTPVISFSSLEDVASRNVYLLSYTPNEQAERIAAYAADRGIKHVAALVPNTPYGQLMLNAFKKAAEKFDLQFMRSATFEPGTTDHSAALDILGQMDVSAKKLREEKAKLSNEYKQLGEAMDDASLTRYREIQQAKPESIVDFEALFIPATAEDLPLLASQLAFYDMDSSQITLLGTGQWQNQKLFESRMDYLRGSYFPGSGSAQDLNNFSARFQSAYGYTPHPLAVLGYDAIRMLAEVYNTEGGRLDNFNKALTRREGFSLTSGPIRFTPKGVPERVYNIYQLHNHSASVVQGAPQVMPPNLPVPVNPLKKKASSVFDFFEGWGF